MCHLLSDISYGGCVVISSLVEPETTEELVKQYQGLRLVHNPDFFTAKRNEPAVIIIGLPSYTTDRTTNKMKNLWHVLEPNIPHTICTSIESELVRICASTCHDLKVGILDEIYNLCQRLDIHYVCKYTNIQVILASIRKTTYFARSDINFHDDTNVFYAYLEKKKIIHYHIDVCMKEMIENRKD
jgi:UDP-glucose 6-dehydrogenase